MYTPIHFKVDDSAARRLLADLVTADLVTATPSGLVATFFSILYEPADDNYGSIFATFPATTTIGACP